MTLRLALGQMDVTIGRPAANMERATALAEQAAEEGTELLVLPELWLSGYDLARAPRHAQSFADEYRERWAALARSTGLYISGSVLAPDPAGRPANTALILSPRGEVLATYRKVHLFEPMEEKRYLSPGSDISCYELPWGRTGMAICYDLRFPEHFGRLTMQGAVLVLLCAQWLAARMEHWRVLLRARAIENQIFLAACNRTGQDPSGTAFGGGSTIIGPWGDILAAAKEDPALLLADLDLSQVRATRETFPVLADRREDLYRTGKE